MSFVHAAFVFAQEAQDEVVLDAAEEGKKVIIGMLIVGLLFISVIALGQLSKWVAHRREARRPSGY
jgi:hypothetical protein